MENHRGRRGDAAGTSSMCEFFGSGATAVSSLSSIGIGIIDIRYQYLMTGVDIIMGVVIGIGISSVSFPYLYRYLYHVSRKSLGVKPIMKIAPTPGVFGSAIYLFMLS